jgi:uncharacterized protein (DUF1015 family)
MSIVAPFRGLRPARGREGEVIAPPYDVLNTQEARARAEGRPWSFLHVSRPEIDLPEGTDPHAPEVYAKAAENFRRMIDEGVLVREEQPVYYVYRLIWPRPEGDHVQTGVIAAASVADYDSNRIRRHEHTRPVKEDDRVRQIEAVAAHTGPVMLAARDEAGRIAALLEAAAQGAPDMDAVADDGIRHQVWIVRDEDLIRRITEAFEAEEALYIADGHHRSAAASRVCAARARREPDNLEAPWRRFLSVIFPAAQMKILDYNRVVRDLNGMSAEEFLRRVGEVFEVSAADEPVRPAARGEFGMYLGGQWYRLRAPESLIDENDPLKRLDVSILQDNLLGPVLGIADPRTDERIDFVGGMRGLGELEKRVDSGEMAVAFSLHPTSMDDLMRVAEAGEVMPAKSTWFEPKLADGLVSLPLED